MALGTYRYRIYGWAYLRPIQGHQHDKCEATAPCGSTACTVRIVIVKKDFYLKVLFHSKNLHTEKGHLNKNPFSET